MKPEEWRQPRETPRCRAVRAPGEDMIASCHSGRPPARLTNSKAERQGNELFASLIPPTSSMKAAKSWRQHSVSLPGPLRCPPGRPMPTAGAQRASADKAFRLERRSNDYEGNRPAALPATQLSSFLEVALGHHSELVGVPASHRDTKSYLSRPSSSGTGSAGHAAFEIHLLELLRASAPHKFNG